MTVRRFPRTLIALALMAATSTAAQGGPHRNSHDSASIVRARVVASEPVYQMVNEPRTECWTESVSYENPRHRHEGSGGAIVGAIAGGLLGSTIGKGNGRVAAAAVGAATGAVIGDRIDDRNDSRMDSRSEGSRQVERCKTIDNPRRVINAYDVRYRYQGRDYSTQLPYDPGRFIKLRVTVAVAEDQRDSNYQRDDERDNDRDDR